MGEVWSNPAIVRLSNMFMELDPRYVDLFARLSINLEGSGTGYPPTIGLRSRENVAPALLAKVMLKLCRVISRRISQGLCTRGTFELRVCGAQSTSSAAASVAMAEGILGWQSLRLQ
jgi:hypothetical protein